MRILVTGANGFVGRSLCKRLIHAGHSVLGTVRSDSQIRAVTPGLSFIATGDINANTDWRRALREVQVVIHLAGRVHVMDRKASADDDAFLEVNSRGTENLARQAAQSGVRRLVFLSTIKVNGQSTRGQPFREIDLPNPVDAYSRSKLLAEEYLKAVALETGLEAVIVRPPLMYGPGVKGNFLSLLNAVSRGYPLPVGSIHNRRSLLSVDGASALLELCASHSKAAGQLFVAAETPAISTSELARTIGRCVNCPARLLPFPTPLLKMAGYLTRSRSRIERLIEDLEIDANKAVSMLGWQNEVDLQESLLSTARWFSRSQTFLAQDNDDVGESEWPREK